MSVDTFKAAKARIEELEAMLKAKANGSGGKLTARIGKSGGISVYGLGRFPVTLHANQWDRLTEAMATEGAFKTTFDTLSEDAKAGETLANGRPAGNAAHQQRVRDAEARDAKRSS